MRIHPLAAAATAAALLGAVAGPALAGTSDAPAAGTATSSLNVLHLSLGGHEIAIGTVALSSDTLSGTPLSKVVVTPLSADGMAYGERTITPASSPASVPSFDSSATLPAALSTVATVKSPVVNVTSSDSNGASSKAGATSLGAVRLLGLPVALDGTVDVSSLVNSTNALGEKTLTVKNLALPSIADVLGALGLDLSKLPVKTLTDLLAGLNITDTAVTTAQQALGAAQAALNAQIQSAQAAVDATQTQLDAAKADLATQLSKLDAAKVDLTAAQAAVSAAQQANDAAVAAQTTAKSQLDAATGAITAVLLPGQTLSGYLSLFPNSTLTTTYNSALDAYNTATALVTSTGTDLANAKTAADVAQTAVNTLQAAVDAAQKLVTDLTATLNSLLDTLKTLLSQLAPQSNALIAAVTAVLDRTPLVSVDRFTVQTKANVTSASSGGQTAKVVGGEIQGVHVLGTDVLSNVLGSTSINLLDLTGSTLSQVTSKIDALTGVLSTVLSAVPGLSVPAPQVGLLTKSTSTGIAGGFGTAADSVKALSVTLPAITLPAALALPNAAQLPAFTGVPDLTATSVALRAAAVGDLVSKPITIALGTLSEQAKFRPASVTAPTAPTTPTTTPTTTTGTPELPRTGLPVGVAVLGLLLVGAGVAVRRRLVSEPLA